MMPIAIKYVKDGGDLKKERIVLQATFGGLWRVMNLGDYLIADTTYQEHGAVSNKLRHVYWFPDYEIGRGDLVILYTRSGDEFFQDSGDGTKSHFFYWGLDKTIWNKEEDSAVLFEVSDWTTTPAERHPRISRGGTLDLGNPLGKYGLGGP